MKIHETNFPHTISTEICTHAVPSDYSRFSGHPIHSVIDRSAGWALCDSTHTHTHMWSHRRTKSARSPKSNKTDLYNFMHSYTWCHRWTKSAGSPKQRIVNARTLRLIHLSKCGGRSIFNRESSEWRAVITSLSPHVTTQILGPAQTTRFKFEFELLISNVVFHLSSFIIFRL